MTTSRAGMPKPRPTPRPIFAPEESPESEEVVVVVPEEASLELVVVESVETVFTTEGTATTELRRESVESKPREEAIPADCMARVKDPSVSLVAMRASTEACRAAIVVVEARLRREEAVTRKENWYPT